MNTIKSFTLLLVLTILFVLIGSWIGGSTGMVVALLLALVMIFGAYWFSDRLVLKMSRAEPLDRTQAPGLYRMVERLSERAGIPVPRLYLVPDPQPNAFATGRNPEHGVVAVTSGLMSILSEREIEGVLAHEIAHIKSRDTLTMAIAASLAGAISTLIQIAQWSYIFGGSDEDDEGAFNPLAFLVAMIVTPLAAMLIQLSISRSREFDADRTAAELTGTSDGLIQALLKLDRSAQLIPATVAQPTTAHMNIVNPFGQPSGSFRNKLAGLFMTHPPMQDRISRLQSYRTPARNAGSGRMRPYETIVS